MYLFFILLHIPLIIYYIIYKDIQIKNYIKEEMMKFHYLKNINNPQKKNKGYKNNKIKDNINKQITQIDDNTTIKTINNKKIKKEINNNLIYEDSEIKNLGKIKSIQIISKDSLNKENNIRRKSNDINYDSKENKIFSNVNINNKNNRFLYLYNLIKIDADNFINNDYLTKYILFLKIIIVQKFYFLSNHLFIYYFFCLDNLCMEYYNLLNEELDEAIISEK